MHYKSLNKQVFSDGRYTILPIRMIDRYKIMLWRNEQIYHLRQNKPLSEKDQDLYFNKEVSNLFDQEKPDQILFSYMNGEECIGYGGLVHINWLDKNAEISFVLDTSLEKEFFEFHWKTYLGLIEKVAFQELNLHKIYTYAFDLRPRLYTALQMAGFIHEATLREHCFFRDQYINVLIHSRLNFKEQLHYRPATINDAKILYEWANDKDVRQNSLSPEPIGWSSHLKWLEEKLESKGTVIFIFMLDNTPIGQVRLDQNEPFWVIDYSVDKNYRGRGFGGLFLNCLIEETNFKPLYGAIKISNVGSLRTFEKAGFKQFGTKIVNQTELIEYIHH